MFAGYLAAFRYIGPAAALVIAISMTSGEARTVLIVAGAGLAVGYAISRWWSY